MRRWIVLSGLFAALWPAVAKAGCTSPTGQEGTIIYATAYHQPQYCNGSGWIPMGFSQTGGGAGCTNPAGTEGQIVYRTDYHVLTYCNGTSWVTAQPGAGATGTGCPGPTGCTNVGDICSDGTVFIGCSAPNYNPIFTTRCDGGRTWNGSTCTGTRVTLPFNNGNTAGETTTGATSVTDGQGNTSTIVATDADSSKSGIQPHKAAAFCKNLNLNGRTDWYLPSFSEAITMYFFKSYLPDYTTNDYYWTSLEQSNTLALVLEYAGGDTYGNDKSNTFYIRCIHK